MRPDEKIFLEHVISPVFQIGVENGRWGIHESEKHFPQVVIWIKAREIDNVATNVYFLFDLTGYPEAAPTSVPWNIELDKKLDFAHWPKGGPLVQSAFNPSWQNGDALYIPCDRIAMHGHDAWKTKHPNDWWTPKKTIVHYLRIVHKLLNSNDYKT